MFRSVGLEIDSVGPNYTAQLHSCARVDTLLKNSFRFVICKWGRQSSWPSAAPRAQSGDGAVVSASSTSSEPLLQASFSGPWEDTTTLSAPTWRGRCRTWPQVFPWLFLGFSLSCKLWEGGGTQGSACLGFGSWQGDTLIPPQTQAHLQACQRLMGFVQASCSPSIK